MKPTASDGLPIRLSPIPATNRAFPQRHRAPAARPGKTDRENRRDRRPTPIKSLLPRIGITTRTLRKLEAIKLVREQRVSRTQEVSYNARPFVLCGLPLRQPRPPSCGRKLTRRLARDT